MPDTRIANQLVVYGARGGIPPLSLQDSRYGVHTTCFGIETDEHFIFIDAGSGLVNTQQFVAQPQPQKPIHIFLTHLHLDHLVGLPSFAPLYDPRQQVHIYGNSEDHGTWRNHLRLLLAPPFWPIPLEDMPCSIKFHELSNKRHEVELGDATVRWQSIPHTGDCLSYRLQFADRSVCIATDHEPTPQSMGAFIQFASDVDILIHDAQYTPSEYPAKRGWGHTTWETAARIAKQANVEQLILTHHDPIRTDAEIDSFVMLSRDILPTTYAAREGRRY